MDFLKKMMGFMCLGGDGFGAFSEMTLKVDLNVESKMYGLPWGNNSFHESLGATDLADSQKRHLKLTSVWRIKCMDFRWKMISFMCLWGRGIWRNRRDDT